MASSSAGSSSTAVLGFEPIRVVDDVINAYSDYVCDCADAMEATLLEHPDFKDKGDQIKQGVDLWMAKTQRAADKSFDQFELCVLKEVFSVPENMQLAPPEAMTTADAQSGAQLDAEMDELWVRLQQALATKRELQRKLTAAQTATQLWQTHRESVQQLASSHEANGAEAAILGAQQITSTLQEGWQLARAADGTTQARAVAGSRGLQQRFAQRRAQINTVSVPDLLQLSSLLTAS